MLRDLVKRHELLHKVVHATWCRLVNATPLRRRGVSSDGVKALDLQTTPAGQITGSGVRPEYPRTPPRSRSTGEIGINLMAPSRLGAAPEPIEAAEHPYAFTDSVKPVYWKDCNGVPVFIFNYNGEVYFTYWQAGVAVGQLNNSFYATKNLCALRLWNNPDWSAC